MEKWRTHVSSSKYLLGQIKDVPFSLMNGLVKAHFQFAAFILDLLGRINEIFQVKYAFVNYCWECLVSLHNFLVCELGKIERGDFSRFPFIGQNAESRPQFVTILKHLILNLTVRFFNVSFSLNKKKMRRFLDYGQAKIMPGAPTDGRERCGISPLLDVFKVRQTLVPGHLSNGLSHLGLSEDWAILDGFLTDSRDEFLRQAVQRAMSLGEKDKKLRQFLHVPITHNLLDGFEIIPRAVLKNLWLLVVRTLTIMPTTFACEQSFSFFKRTIHINMSEETAKIFLNARMGLYKRIYTL